MKTRKRNPNPTPHDYYLELGKPCCAGCDYWHYYDGYGRISGECTKTAPVAGSDRLSLLGITNHSGQIPSGHIMTKRDYVCGEFHDSDLDQK